MSGKWHTITCARCGNSFEGVHAKLCPPCVQVARVEGGMNSHRPDGEPRRMVETLSRDRWSPSAVHCYETGENCMTCDSGRSVNFAHYGGCRMPEAIKQLLETVGKPRPDLMTGSAYRWGVRDADLVI